MVRVKFSKRKERLKLAGGDQGLGYDNRVLLRGNKSAEEASGGLEAFLSRNGGSKRSRARDDAFDEDELSSGGSLSDLDFGSGGSSPSPPRRGRRSKAPAARKSRMSRMPSSPPMSPPSVASSSSGGSSGSDGGSSGSRSSSSSGSSPSSQGSDSGSELASSDSGSSLSDAASSSASESFRGPSRKSQKKKAPASSGLSDEAEAAEKQDLLAHFHRLRAKGVPIAKVFTTRSNLTEMRLEMGRIQHEQETGMAMKKNQRMFMLGTSALTKVTENYGPKMIRERFKGFDTHVLESISEYDQIFQQISEEHGDLITAIFGKHPAVQLFFLLASQLFLYGFVHEGAKKAQMRESVTSDELRTRYPNVFREALLKEHEERQRIAQEDTMRAEQARHRSYMEFDARQRAELDARRRMELQHPGPSPPVQRAPDPWRTAAPFDTTAAPRLAPQQQQQQPVVQPSYSSEVTQLLAEQQAASWSHQVRHGLPPANEEIPAPRARPVQESTQAVNTEPDPFDFASMHAALPQVDDDELQDALGGRDNLNRSPRASPDNSVDGEAPGQMGSPLGGDDDSDKVVFNIA